MHLLKYNAIFALHLSFNKDYLMRYTPLHTFLIILFVSVVLVAKMCAAACSDQTEVERIGHRKKDRALMRAVKTADVPSVATLLHSGANPNYRRSLSGETTLMAAVGARVPRERMFDIAIVTRMLLEHKANVNAKKTVHDNITALHYVVPRTDITNGVALYLIALLLRAGADRSIAAKSTYAQLPLCGGAFTPYQQAANAAKLFKDIYPMLARKFAVRAEFIMQFTPRRRINIKNDDWLSPADAVTQTEKAINMLRVNGGYRKNLSQKSKRVRRATSCKSRSDLFINGW
jgi:hypothetical protein